MQFFQTVLILLLGATFLSTLARRMGVPYPTVLAVAGGIVAFVPGTPKIELPPDLILALFVAPVLLDAAFDASLRDLRRNWKPILSLVWIAVALTTVTVAIVARMLFPDLPWAAAIALGALLAPPDAVAALAVLKHVAPPHRIRMVLEGESLLNDATSLLIYRLAVGAVAAGSFSLVESLPTFGVVVFGSVVAGWLLAWPSTWLIRAIDDAPSSVIVQFVTTFGVWLLAEHIGLSGVVTIVVYAVTVARRDRQPAHLRVPSFAIWETVTFVLNVLAFTLIGLQVRPIFDALTPPERVRYVLGALLILGVVIAVRIVWVMTHEGIARWTRPKGAPSRTRGSLVVSWSGMRGIVTLAAALALPVHFPYRDFIQVTAFVVVLGTLILQGLTLRPLLLLLRLPPDDTVESELQHARKIAMKAALHSLDGEDGDAAERLRREYHEALGQAREGHDPRDRQTNQLRQRAVTAARAALTELRATDAIGDDAYHRVEEELDWVELSARSRP